ncbi:MAG: DUF2393 family protein [Sulfurospirillaceae bacterium]|nr:DUF2393 family protein [Sulfurospirillaceae bacterium]MDD2825482.1 DUF2393 family protein [Sulfurospirillaceae bacterium]
MSYFTFLHWFALVIIGVLLILFLVLIFQNSNEKFPLSSIFTAILSAVILTVFSFYALDKYTKSAILEHVIIKKILINESFSISGQIRNIGNFTISSCSLEVKLSNDLTGYGGEGAPRFEPKSVFDNLFKRGNETNTIETSKTFVITEDLYKGEMRNFSVFMRYPPSFSKPTVRYELFCH